MPVLVLYPDAKEIPMEDKKLFLIGEVAKMFHISMGTLRHYEQAGLLTPEYTDPDTGYRYYGTRQFELLNTIRYLRVLDFPLAQIKTFLDNRDTDVIEEKLVHQKEVIARKQKELELISRKIDHRLEQLRDAMNSRLDVIQTVEIPESRVVWLRDSLHPKTYLDLENSIRKLVENQKESLVFMGKIGIGISKEQLSQKSFQDYDRIFLLLDQEDRYDGETETFPRQTCVTIRFCGSHREAPAYYQKLLAYIEEKKFCITGFSRETTLIDYGITNNTDKFVTEIQIPVNI